MTDEPKKKKDAAFHISAEDLTKSMKNRPILKCTLSLDVSLGGGIPLGCTVLMAGPEKSGKTTTCLQYAAYGQNHFKCKVFYFPIEGRLTNKVLEQVRDLKKDIDNFVIVMPPPIYDQDDSEKIIGYEKWTSERWWEEIGDTITNNHGCILIVDSIANMSSEKEISEDMGHQDRGGKNKLEAQFCRKYGDLIISNRNTVFLMTQMQANTSGYGPSIQPKVGNQIKFQSDVILVGKNVEKWTEDASGKIYGHDAVYIVRESALGAPHMEARIPIRYGYGIDDLQDIVNYSVNWGFIKNAGAWFELPYKKTDDDGFEYFDLSTVEEKERKKDKSIVKIQGSQAVRNWFLMNPKQAEEMKTKMNKLFFG